MDELNIEPNKKKTSKKAKLFFIFLSALILIGLNVLLGVKFFHLVENRKNTKVAKEVAKKETKVNEATNNTNEQKVFKGIVSLKSKDKNCSKNKKCKKHKSEKIDVEIIKNGNDIKVISNGQEIDGKKKIKIIKAFEKQNNVEILDNNKAKEETKETIEDDVKKREDANRIMQNLGASLGMQNEMNRAENIIGYDKLVEKLASSVVHIKLTSLTDADDLGRYKLLQALDGEVFPAKKVKVQATCSGFFVSTDGYIVTNHHCIDDAQNVDVETKNGNKYSAKIIGYFEGADLAVIKIEPKNNEKFNSVKIADSDKVAVGDNIVVIGGPLGYKWSASAGIISGKSRTLDDIGSDGPKKHAWGTAGEYIQVDAAINGGNSGGPAFNMKGEVVGVAAAGYTFLQGMKFIISSNTLTKILDKLKNGTIIQKGLWGISVNELEPHDIKAIGLEKNSGMIVSNVVHESPAEKAGLKRGDVILKVNGKELKDAIVLKQINSEVFDGSVSELEINRYGKIKKIKIKAVSVKEIDRLEKGEIGIQDWNDGNISYRLLTSRMHRRFRLPKEVSGVIITDIKNNDDPFLMLAVGDIIVGVNDKKISSIEDYQKALKELRKNKKDMAVFHVYKPTRGDIIVKGSKIS